jgi:hypothetical protein
LGLRHLPGSTPVEFLASRSRSLIVIATAERWFAISPSDPEAFLRAYKSLTELGSLIYLPRRSAQPAALLANFWADLPARLLILVALALNLGLLVWVSLAIPTHPRVPFRFSVDGSPRDFVPAVRLLLLPAINSLILLVDLLLGLFFYRRLESRIAAYMLWISGIVTALFFLGAIFFLLRAA